MPFEARVDPSIIFRSQDPLDEQAKGLSLRQGLREEQGALQDQRRQQSLRQALSGADLSTPEGQQDAIGKVMRIDPNAGMKLQESFAKQQEQRQMSQLHGAQTQEAIAKTGEAQARTGDVEAQKAQRERDNFATMLGAAAKSTESAWGAYQQDLKQYPKSMAESKFRKTMGEQKDLLESTYGPIAKKVTDKFDPSTFMVDDVPQQIQMMKGVAGKMGQQAQQHAESPIGKVMEDFSAGRIDKKTMEAMVKKETNIPVPQSIVTANLLDPAAIEEAADQYNLNHTMPPNMQRNPAAAARVANEAAKKNAAAGIGGVDTAVNREANRADSKSLGNLTKQSDMIKSFESTALKNLDMLVAQSERVPRSDFMLLNKALETGQLQGGSVETAKFFAIVKPFVDEYAKILSGQTGAAGASDTARKEAAGIISPYMSKDQIKALAPFIKQELNNRTSSLTEQADAINKRMSNRVRGVTEPEKPAPSKAADSAPDSAIQHLKQHPELKDAFKSKYGYLPE